ncbi:hypothetical protein [Bifidobacterium sp. SO1]|uniref:hypothetical protein n=1 Tax=Bifidobacterium sp. SO1 TaxID=2809029 RepID=UPI001BDBCFF0|nr:hypothetical protein [Bifidobacterium sp. SO1]MBT1161749.1 hypothetical protein [Bifidobacterium sp. SO1]
MRTIGLNDRERVVLEWNASHPDPLPFLDGATSEDLIVVNDGCGSHARPLSWNADGFERDPGSSIMDTLRDRGYDAAAAILVGGTDRMDWQTIVIGARPRLVSAVGGDARLVADTLRREYARRYGTLTLYRLDGDDWLRVDAVMVGFDDPLPSDDLIRGRAIRLFGRGDAR